MDKKYKCFEKNNKNQEYESYEHQRKILEILDKMDQKKNKFSTLVSVPTGGGKTKIAADFCVKKLAEKKNKVLWLADRILLLKQAIGRFEKMNMPRDLWYQLICSTENEGAFSITKIEENSDLLFASVSSMTWLNMESEKMESFLKWLKTVGDTGKLYIIYDEAHHIGAEKINDFLKNLLSENSETESNLVKIENYALIGLTATIYYYGSPFESFNKWFKDGWSEQEQKIVTDNSPMGEGKNEDINNKIEIIGVKDLIDKKILKEANLIRIDDFKDRKPENDEEERVYLARKIAKYYKKEKWGKTIVFVRTKEMAKELVEVLKEELKKELKKKEILCFAYISEDRSSDMKDMERNYDVFKSEKTKEGLMVAVDKVSEGFDVRNLKTIYLYAKTNSQIKMRQRIGRVLRTSKDKDSCNVIWQKYFREKQPENDPKKIHDTYIIESKKEIDEDKAEYKKSGQLYPAIYLEDLPKDSKEIRRAYLRLEFLDILEVFDTEAYIEGEGVVVYRLGDGNNIYVLSNEEKGYLQYYQMILTDYYSVLRFEKEYEKFSHYAKAYNITEERLLENIKKICFYMCDIRRDDTRGVICKKRLRVLDKDIKKFYEYVMSHDLEYPMRDGSFKNDAQENSGGRKFSLEYLEKYLKDHNYKDKDKAKDLIGAMKQYQTFRNRVENLNTKKYADCLPYGKLKNFQYSEMESARFLMHRGAFYQERMMGKIKENEKEYEIALMGYDKDKGYTDARYSKNFKMRIVKNLTDDIMLIASALNTVPNHIAILEQDVKEYTDRLEEKIPEFFEVKEFDKKNASLEFLMALGYMGEKQDMDEDTKQDLIIRMQCKMLKEPVLPRLLQYVIYCRCYKKFSNRHKKKLKEKHKEDLFYNKGELCENYPNRKELEDMYQKQLESYGVSGLNSDLTVVEDVIYDACPYLKVVPFYQGIKPEFLCRMLNDILLFKKGGCDYKTLVDAFGGSGAVSMNISQRHKLKVIYNDYGIMNESFYKSLKENNGLRNRIEEFIELVINKTGQEKKVRKFFKPYKAILSCSNIENNNEADYDYINDSCVEIEKKYRDKIETSKTNENEDESPILRLEKLEKKYASLYEKLSAQNVQEGRISEIHKFLHPIILKVSKIYHLLLKCKVIDSDGQIIKLEYNRFDNNDKVKDKQNKGIKLKTEDIALIFFIYNSFVSRHFYSGATINILQRFVGNYEKWLDWGSEVFKEIDVKRSDALELMEKYREEGKYVWYCDIPYTETSAGDYSKKFLDMDNFLKKLSDMKGDYIISSRFNIINDKNEEDVKSENNKYKVDVRALNVFKFYNSFNAKKERAVYEMTFKNFVKEEYPEQDTESSKNNNGWRHIEEGREAKYILFAYTKARMRQILDKIDIVNTENGNCDSCMYKIDNVNDILSKEAVHRMLQGTWRSKIPVEVMLTNIEIDVEKMPIQEIEKGKIWYAPTFATPSSYMTEPVVIIIKYEEYMQILLKTFSKKFYTMQQAREAGASFWVYYKEKEYNG